MRRLPKRGILPAVIAIIAVVALFSLTGSGSDGEQVAFGKVIEDAQAGLVQKIEVDGRKLKVTYAPQGGGAATVMRSRMGPNGDLSKLLADAGVQLSRQNAPAGAAAVDVEYASGGGSPWFGLILNLLPFLLIGLFLVFIVRRARGAGSQAMGFGKSKARLFTGGATSVAFTDVAGVDEAKEELAEVVEFLKFPEKFSALGARIPRGVLLVGPPGTGKTLLARAVAGEAGVPFLSISGSEFVEMFVGVGASRVRDLFEQAKKSAPCIVFVDEIDAVGRQRGAGLGNSNDEREQTLNQILVQMDGFENETNVIVIAATNRPDILDPALLRPGRFDRKVILDAPDVKGRAAILSVHAKGKPIADDVQVATLAKSTPGLSGADLANLVNEAAILAARRSKKVITMKEFEAAIDRVIAGPERKSRVMSAHEKKLTAYHEGGHTVVGHFMDHHDPPHKVTIVSHGMAGGYTRFLPDEESHYRTGSMFKDQLCTALGGYAAEELIFGEASTGPSNDIEQVTRIARAMVTRWGMSDRLGPRTFGRNEELIFLGRDISETRNYSEKVAEEIDDEVRRLVEEAQERARDVLREHRALLDKLASALLDVETLEGDQLQQILESDPHESWTPPADSLPAEPKQPASAPGEAARRQPIEPSPVPGLAADSSSSA